jgi:hypothetical protein
MALDMAVFLTAVKTAAAIHDYVQGGPLQIALKTFSDMSLKAARESLAKIRLADDPQIQVKLAMGHLKAAHSGYHQDYAHAGLLKKTLRFDLVWQAATKDFWTNCFLAICYADLGQARLVKHHLQFACHARSVALKMCEVDSDEIRKTIESGSTWDKIKMRNKMISAISTGGVYVQSYKLAYDAIYADYSIYRINVVHFEEFCSQLTGCPWRIADHESEPSTNE